MTHDIPERRTDSVARIDRAHSRSPASPIHESAHVFEDVAPSAPATLPPQSAEQIRIQAGELAAHLRGRLRSIDQREAHLNAHIARLENDLSSARLWQRERLADLTERENQLQRDAEELRQRIQQLSLRELTAEDACLRRETELKQRELELARWEANLAQRQMELTAEAQRVRESREQFREEAEKHRPIPQGILDALLRNAGAAVAVVDMPTLATVRLPSADDESRRIVLSRISPRHEWELRLEKLDVHLSQRLEEFTREHEDLVRHQTRAWQAVIGQRQSLVQQQRERELEWIEAKKMLTCRRERLEHREKTCDHLRRDILNIHRDALEMRVVFEELLARFIKSAPNLADTTVIRKIQSRLATLPELIPPKPRQGDSTLVGLAKQLKAKLECLREARAQLGNWWEQKTKEHTEYETRLAEHERLLHEQHNGADTAHQQRIAELKQIQAQIRQLHHELRKSQPAEDELEMSSGERKTNC